ncbi:MAG: carbon monoxide dehydrogenase [Microbacteriaceae bacterium]|nr:MAG: carbon monoxide dehydrogenase [Microbacteriaceae bacterium]
MKLEHRFVVPAPIDVVWAAFNDLERLVPCVPGGTLISAEGDTFEGTVKVKLGPISMLYGGTGTFLERDQAAGRMVVEAKGKDKRGNGTAGATVVAQLTAGGAGTVVEVSTDLSVTGKPAQFGRGVIQDVSDKLLGQFVDCISAKLGPDAASAVAAEKAAPGNPAPATEAPAKAAPAKAAPAKPAAATPPVAQSTSTEPVPAPSAPTQPAPARDWAPPSSEPAELNLLSTVLPVMIRRYAVPGLLALVGVGFFIWMLRRRR